MATIHHEGRISFAVPLPRALLRDKRLSFGARGLFAFLWDLPDGWIIRLSHLAKMSPDGRDAIRSRLAELEAVGALQIEAIRGKAGRVAGKRWVITAPEIWAIEMPLSCAQAEDGAGRCSDNPMVGEHDAKVWQDAKVHQPETGDQQSNKTTVPLHPSPQKMECNGAKNSPSLAKLGTDDLEEMREALEARGRVLGKRDPALWARSAVVRIRSEGATASDLAVLAEHRQRKEASFMAARANSDASAPSMLDLAIGSQGVSLVGNFRSKPTTKNPLDVPPDWARQREAVARLAEDAKKLGIKSRK